MGWVATVAQAATASGDERRRRPARAWSRCQRDRKTLADATSRIGKEKLRRGLGASAASRGEAKPRHGRVELRSVVWMGGSGSLALVRACRHGLWPLAAFAPSPSRTYSPAAPFQERGLTHQTCTQRACNPGRVSLTHVPPTSNAPKLTLGPPLRSLTATECAAAVAASGACPVEQPGSTAHALPQGPAARLFFPSWTFLALGTVTGDVGALPKRGGGDWRACLSTGRPSVPDPALYARGPGTGRANSCPVWFWPWCLKLPFG